MKMESKAFSQNDVQVREYLEFIDYYIPHIKSLDLLDDPNCPYYFDIDAAEDVLVFIEKGLKHTKGELAGKFLILDDWQRAIFLAAFGFKRKSDGSRRFREIWLELPRKNGKSTISSGFALVLLYVDEEPGAEVYTAAADKSQAKIVFNIGKQMVLKNKSLEKRSEIYRDSIVFKGQDSSLIALSADAYSKHGLNASGIIVDEVHAHKDRELIDVLHTSTGSRRQPMEVYITTAGVYDPHSIYFEKHDYAEKVIKGIIKDDELLAVIYAATDKDDWKDPEVHKRVNPGYGVSVKAEYLAKECKKAQEVPAYENTFKRLHLNIITQQVTRWMPMDLWLSRSAVYDDSILKGQLVWAGLDLSTTLDITAFQMLFRCEDGIYRNKPIYWVPEENARKRQKADRVPYLDWIRDGHLIATPGNVVDYGIVRRDINQSGEQLGLKKGALDRWNAVQLATELESDGFEIVMFGQGFASMNAPMKELMTLVQAGKFLHCNDPVTNWMMSNVSAKTDPAGNIKPDKSKSTGRIDGVVALIMALGLAIKDQGDSSIYEKRGLTIL